MINVTIMLFVTLFIGLAVIGGVIVLQVFLSRKENKCLGLILPAIAFIYSLIMVLSIAAFNSMTGGEIFVLVASTLLLSNIPTLVLLGIYFGCREKLKRKSQLDKMNIQDLE